MAESAVRTDKRFLLMVYGTVGVLSAIIMGISVTFLHTTIQWAAAILLVGMLVAIGYLAIEL